MRISLGQVAADVPTGSGRQSVGETLEQMAGRSFEMATHVVVLEGNRAVGLISIESILGSEPQMLLGEFAGSVPPSVKLGSDEDLAVHVMVDTRVGCLVVTDSDGAFKGLVSAEQMLSLLVTEHDEDLARIGGYLAGTSRARSAASESVARRLWHRLPWLLLGLAGAMCSALIMGAFDARLEANVLIALFVPAIVYMADAVGTQTETVLIRALAAGVTTRSIVARELLTGAIIGVAIGVAFFLFALAGWGDVNVAAAVGLALVASSTIATAVAMVLPSLFQRYGVDPAFGSGPLATVIQDLLSILTYFAVVVLLVG